MFAAVGVVAGSILRYGSLRPAPYGVGTRRESLLNHSPAEGKRSAFAIATFFSLLAKLQQPEDSAVDARVHIFQLRVSKYEVER